MGLITEITNQVFNLEEIRTGDLVYARHKSWTEGRSGFVTAIDGDEITIQYFPKIGTITNHYIVRAGEIIEGNWEIRWSRDLEDIRDLTVTEGSGS